MSIPYPGAKGVTKPELDAYLNSFPNPAGEIMVASFDTYYQKHCPTGNCSAGGIYLGWVLTFVGSGIAKSIGIEMKAGGELEYVAAKGTVTGLNQTGQDIFHGLNLETWVLRIGEILLGVVLIGVGIAKLTGTENAISKIAKTGVVAAAV